MKSKVLMVLAGAAVSSVALAASPDKDRAQAAEMSADAAMRSSQLAAGSDNFKITAGENTLYIGGYTQFRWTSDFRSSGQTAPNENYTHGFNTPITRVKFWGNTWTKELTYNVLFNFNNGSSGTLDDAEFRYTWDNGFYVRGGQYKLPFLREELVGDDKQLFVTRSTTNLAFTQGRSQGLELGYKADAWRMMFNFNDGGNAKNQDYNAANQADWAATFRAECQCMGTDWSRWNDFSSWRDSDSNGLLAGVAFHAQQMGRTGPSLKGSSDNNTMFAYTADLSWESAGWGLFGSFIGNHLDQPSGQPNVDNFGWVLQGSVFATDQVEFALRYNAFHADKDIRVSGGKRNFHWLTFGANYYVSPRSHTFKINADVVYSLSRTTGQLTTNPFNLPNSDKGVLGQNKKGEVAVQVQAQVMW